jgi:hypothetical protein
MRIEHRYLTFEKDMKLTKLLDQLTIKYKVTEKRYAENVELYALEFFLHEDNPRFSVLRDAVSDFEINPQTGTIYEKTDYSTADWFIINTGEYQYPQPEDGYEEATFNVEKHCTHCGIGKVQNAPYRFRTDPKQHNNQFWGLRWEFDAIFVRQAAKNILEKEEISGISFSNPVLHKSGIPISEFYQLHINTILKTGFDSYNTKTITCKINNEENLNVDLYAKYCGGIKFHHPMIGGYLFNRGVFDKKNDIVQSSEYFGSGGSASKLQIVSKRFKNIVDANKLKGLSFIPVIHEKFER